MIIGCGTATGTATGVGAGNASATGSTSSAIPESVNILAGAAECYANAWNGGGLLAVGIQLVLDLTQGGVVRLGESFLQSQVQRTANLQQRSWMITMSLS